MEDANDLEKTYSREQQRLGHELREVTTPHTLIRSISLGQESVRIRTNEEDVDAQLELEKEDSFKEETSPVPSSDASNPVPPARTIIRFEDGDPEQPNNWPRKRKLLSMFIAVCTVMNSTISSSLAAGATGPISEHFNNYNESQLILPTSIYLVGYVLGPLIWGPISESYGRKWTMLTSFALFTVFSIAASVAPNFAALIIFRLLVGVGGSCAISVVGGICADVYHNPKSRGRAMAYFMASTTFGPILGPPISGFISTISWTWAFWIGVIIAGANWPLLICFPETYAPIILKKRARQLRKETGDDSIVAPIELEKRDFNHIVTVVLTRPLRMLAFEPLVLFTCLYLSYAYAIFYIFFQSYPIIFTGIYGFSPGEEGLAFLPIGVGAIISACIYIAWDNILERAQQSKKPWSKSEEMRRLPLACIAGPFFVISSFWLGWTAREGIHWIVPCLAGISFGIGYLCLFMALLNYLVDAYEIFAASAMAAASFSRSSFGAILPFAAKPMYRALGVPWACSVLGFLSLAMCVIPFAFLRWGTKLRQKSKFCQYLAQKKRDEAEAREREADRRMPEDVVAADRNTDAKQEPGEDKC
ncbi:major facilitator superfamily domain-containing protein [Lophiotrema nucula]|uniref:Major facilitator superfamily domain-containing protein n=1 Tax=Lophiotrema nucula TaxID=690887 RepID=A0A6A5ZM37_9PLEO|nr:major facilitator superfamily domain-containing protein [Lophiotrema nucula]